MVKQTIRIFCRIKPTKQQIGVSLYFDVLVQTKSQTCCLFAFSRLQHKRRAIARAHLRTRLNSLRCAIKRTP